MWSVSFVGWMTLIILLGRLMAVWTVHGLFHTCCKMRDINVRELIFISYGGMIRGAIAFALVLKIPSGNSADGTPAFRERDLVVTTTLAVVIITTVLFGSFMPVI